MAQAHDATFAPSSPRSSSGGADSYNHEATPETKPTVFSPDDKSAKSNKVLTALSLDGPSNPLVRFPSNPADGFAGHLSAVERDPFISTTGANKAEHKLSPTASAFRPVSVPLVAHGSLDALQGVNSGFGAHHQPFATQAAVKFSSELGLSRCLVIYSSTYPLMITDVEGYLTKLDQLGSPCRGKRNAVAVEGRLYLHVSDVRDARHIHDSVQLASPDWRAEYLAAVEFHQACGLAAHADPIYDGKVQVTAFLQGPNMGFVHIETVVRTFLETQGEVFALLRQSEANDLAFRAVAEYSDADVAVSVVHRFNRTTIGGCHLILTLCQLEDTAGQLRTTDGHRHPFHSPQDPIHDMASRFQGIGVSEIPQHANALIPAGRLNQSPTGLHGPQQLGMHPAVYRGFPGPGPSRFMDHTPTRGQGAARMMPMSPMSGRMPIMGSLYHTTPPATPMAMPGSFASPRSIQPYGRRQNATRVMRAPFYNNAGHHNHVDVNRIQEGIDVRTTIMLRNIPNKVDQAMLKRLIDESSWGKYDFMYLRIDFANDCNVGYAFINFVDPLDIIDFVNARGNQRWNCFKSDKIAEISYATIQGKDCLVQKFRNSSVMLEAPHYRPKLYYTSNGPRPELAGQEEPFPEPDNQSKMKRSCENAEHVGLFTPSSGQHFRDEQRRRRSQYDRGTRLAALEEYDAQVQQQGLFLMR